MKNISFRRPRTLGQEQSTSDTEIVDETQMEEETVNPFAISSRFVDLFTVGLSPRKLQATHGGVGGKGAGIEQYSRITGNWNVTVDIISAKNGRQTHAISASELVASDGQKRERITINTGGKNDTVEGFAENMGRLCEIAGIDAEDVLTAGAAAETEESYDQTGDHSPEDHADDIYLALD